MVARKVVIIGLSATLLVAAAAIAALFIVQNKNDEGNAPKRVNESQKAIRDLCQNTYYQKTCISTLSKGTNSSDSTTLISVGFQIAIHELGRVMNKTRSLQEAAKDPKMAEAYKTCRKLLDDSIYDLKSTADRVESLDITDFKTLSNDIKTWLTGALTYQETCLDCFEDTKGEEAEKMKKLLNLSRELTVNGLALANSLTDLGVQLGFRRRLMATNSGNRRLFQAQKSLSTKGARDLRQARKGRISPNVVVAKDGSGKYTTINEALQEAPHNLMNGTYVVYIKEGVYEEYVSVNRTQCSIMLLGDGPTKTKIVGDRSYKSGWETFWSATLAIEGEGFIAKDIAIENRAGPEGHQAVAVRASADKIIFHNCRLDGFQDTLYAHNHRQYYRDCTISGTIDFIFGNAKAVFQNCTLLIRKPLASQKLCMVTAQGRTAVNQTSAIVLQNCRIVPAPDYPIGDKSYKTYLGRPWKKYSRTIVMDSEIDGLVNPSGWSEWEGTKVHLDTCWYAEVNNKGSGSSLKERVKWPGYKKVSTKEAATFTPEEFMVGDSWIAGKGIPYDSGRAKNQTVGF